MISIPLAVLGSVAALSALGQTINVMTLGGLALAVGILVDDATVTIENINWHLEHGSEIETAIMDGARQIVVPATVSLLCILIVFVPMFTLGGVAGYLFRPLAEAVAFALIASDILSRTLVPTLANYLLAGQAHEHEEPSKPTGNPLVRFQRGFERRFEGVRNSYRRLLEKALGARGKFIAGFLVAVCLSFALAPLSGAGFLPRGRKRANRDSCLCSDRHTDRGDVAGHRQRGANDPFDHCARGASFDCRQYRAADQRHQPRL
jgi:multidrug efflux pump subunit AcrB